MGFLGYLLYAVGIIGGVEGVLKRNVPISVVALLVVAVGGFLLSRK